MGNGGEGVRVEELRADGVTANGNAFYGISAFKKIKGTNITANGNGSAGITSDGGMKASGVTVTGNGSPAEDYDNGGGILVTGGPLQLTGSSVTGNTYFPADGPPIPGDLIASRTPKLAGATCGNSLSIDRGTGDLGPSWGVCAND